MRPCRLEESCSSWPTMRPARSVDRRPTSPRSWTWACWRSEAPVAEPRDRRAAHRRGHRGEWLAAAALLGLVGGRITSSIVAEKREESDGVDVARQPVAQPAVTYPETPYATEVRTAPQAYADPYAPAPQPSDPYRPEARPVADPYAQPGQDPFAPPAGGSTDGIGR